MTKRLLLSGFPGWLGDNIVDWFYTNKDHDYTHLRCIVAPWITKNQIDEYALKYPQLEIVFGDFTNRSDLEKACLNCDAIIHSAGIIHVNRVNQWYDVNTEGTKLFHTVAEKNNIKKFIFISSNAAGGRSIENELLTENHPNQPLSDYGHSKKQAEDYLLKNNQITKSVILRPCMFYGMPVPHRHVDIFKRIEAEINAEKLL